MPSIGMLQLASILVFVIGIYFGFGSSQKKIGYLNAIVSIFTFPLSLISVFAFTVPFWGRTDNWALGLLVLPVVLFWPVALFAIGHIGWLFGKATKLREL